MVRPATSALSANAAAIATIVIIKLTSPHRPTSVPQKDPLHLCFPVRLIVGEVCGRSRSMIAPRVRDDLRGEFICHHYLPLSLVNQSRVVGGIPSSRTRPSPVGLNSAASIAFRFSPSPVNFRLG